jgi:hypothetical protein
MKRIIPFIIIAITVFSSCEYEVYNAPFADFSVDKTIATPGSDIRFINYSSEATYFEWDFGDGSISNAHSPYHYYTHEGIYQVRLAAFNGSYVDYAYLTVEVYFTTLEIQVREYYSDELIPRVNVVVYANEYDYIYYGAPVFSGTSDYNGTIIIDGLNPQSYYVDVFSNLYNNYTLASEDISFVKTLPLEYAMHNIFTAYVDYDPVIGNKSANTENRVREVKVTHEKRSLKEKQESLK